MVESSGRRVDQLQRPALPVGAGSLRARQRLPEAPGWQKLQTTAHAHTSWRVDRRAAPRDSPAQSRTGPWSPRSRTDQNSPVTGDGHTGFLGAGGATSAGHHRTGEGKKPVRRAERRGFTTDGAFARVGKPTVSDVASFSLTSPTDGRRSRGFTRWVPEPSPVDSHGVTVTPPRRAYTAHLRPLARRARGVPRSRSGSPRPMGWTSGPIRR